MTDDPKTRPEPAEKPLYGIWMTVQHWGCENGGDDVVGSKEEIEAKAVQWRSSLLPGQTITYEVRPYSDPPLGVEACETRAELRARLDELEKAYEFLGPWDQGTPADHDGYHRRIAELKRLIALAGGPSGSGP